MAIMISTLWPAEPPSPFAPCRWSHGWTVTWTSPASFFFFRGISFQNDGRVGCYLLGLGLRVALGRSAMQWYALWAHTVRWIVLSTAVPQQSDRTRRCGRSLSALSCGQSCRRSATRRQVDR